jgi:hypothetical protein
MLFALDAMGKLAEWGPRLRGALADQALDPFAMRPNGDEQGAPFLDDPIVLDLAGCGVDAICAALDARRADVTIEFLGRNECTVVCVAGLASLTLWLRRNNDPIAHLGTVVTYETLAAFTDGVLRR